MRVAALTGFKDSLPPDTSLLRKIEDTARRVFGLYGFQEIRFPIVEKTALFLRSIGETTEIVEKQMYTFQDTDGESLSLRPEGTASVVRAYIEHSLFQKEPYSKLWYGGPMFRHEKPQKGRFRQFSQIGAEVFGLTGPRIDAELLDMLMRFFDGIGVKGLEVQINSLGCGECRPAYTKALLSFFAANAGGLCEDHQKRSAQNPFRVMDCKKEPCRAVSSKAPSILDSLCAACRAHFDGVQGTLKVLNIASTVNARIVRGLDYYTRTVFEMTSSDLGAQNAVVAGGRYDDLVEGMGGRPTPAIGFAVGVERLLSLMGSPKEGPRVDVFVAAWGREPVEKGIVLARDLRRRGWRIERGYPAPGSGKGEEEASIKSQMNRANALQAGYVAIIGPDELTKGIFKLKDMEKKTEEPFPLEKACDIIHQKLSRSSSRSPGD